MESYGDVVPQYETFYDKKNKELVYDIYRVDFDAYFYDKKFPTIQ